MNLFYFRDQIEAKLFKKKHCPVDHKNRQRLNQQGADHAKIDRPLEHVAELSQPKPADK